jgi:hypothetical protein
MGSWEGRKIGKRGKKAPFGQINACGEVWNGLAALDY